MKNLQEADYLDKSNNIDITSFKNMENDPTVASVIVGTDYNLTMRKMCEASLYLNSNRNYIEFLGTNVDRTDGKDRLRPSGGSIVKLIETLSGNSIPSKTIGKPDTFGFNLLRD